MTAPEQQATRATTPATAASASIDPATQMGVVAITVADLDRSLAYYTDGIGFALLERDGSHATLGAGGMPLLLLTEVPDARRFPHDRPGYTGLYHFAILVPTRADLGRWLRHWLESGQPLPGQGDHLVSEALYLTDPDGHGIEIYRDRPRSEWTYAGGFVRMATDPVDIRGVLEEAEREGKPWAGMAAGTRLGHMHLQVGDISQAAEFYHGILGFDIMAAMPSALFISAGGYHHHIGMNTWHSRGAAPTPADVARLSFYTIDFATEEARATTLARLAAAGVAYQDTPAGVLVRDPWQNILVLRVGAVTDAEAAATLAAAVPHA